MDHVKADVARIVREAIDAYMPRAQQDVEVRSVDDLTTIIRLPTTQGPRYFVVKVSEQR